MALEDIIKKINEDAKAEAESLLSLARAEAEAIREKARREANELRADLTEKAKRKAKEHADRIGILAGLDERKDFLREKKRLIDEAFAIAEDEIKNLPPDEYLDFLKPLILNAVESGNEEIIPSAGHRVLFTPEFMNSVNTELGAKGHLRLSEESGDFSGGFVLREGNKETNLTLGSLIETQHQKLEPQVAHTLFG